MPARCNALCFCPTGAVPLAPPGARPMPCMCACPTSDLMCAVDITPHVIIRHPHPSHLPSPRPTRSYEVTVDVAPSVKWKGERPYAALQVEVEVEDDGDEAAKAAADRQIRTQLKSMGRLNISQDAGLKVPRCMPTHAPTCTRMHAAQEHGQLNISQDSGLKNGQKGDPILSATQKGFQLDTEEGEYLLPGMVEALIGMQRGQTREFQLTFPPTWQTESLRNLPATFTVKCQELFVRELPELTDELAEKFLPGVATIASAIGTCHKCTLPFLTSHHLCPTTLCITPPPCMPPFCAQQGGGGVAGEQQQKRKQATLNAIVNALGEVCEMAVPNSLLEEQGRQMYGAKLIELQTEGKVQKEQVAALMAEGMVENYLRAQRDKIRAPSEAVAGRAGGVPAGRAAVQRGGAGSRGGERRGGVQTLQPGAAEVLEGKTVLDWLASHATITYSSTSLQTPHTPLLALTGNTSAPSLSPQPRQAAEVLEGEDGAGLAG
ncbi:unnamed protein product [Closterium sp. Naga37s-1]|nr:unnamed protein product [Closterium sp. Naga37s-1]